MKNKCGVTVTLLASVILFVCFVSLPIVAQDFNPDQVEFESLVFDDVPGTYAIYRISKNDKISYIGLCAIGGNELAVRYYEKDSGFEILAMERFYTKKDPQDPSRLRAVEGSVEMIRGNLDHVGSQYVFPMVLEWIDEWLGSKQEFDTAPEYRTGKDNAFLYQFWIPLVQFRESTGTFAGEVSLVTVGVASSGTDPVFFEWNGDADIAFMKTKENEKSSKIVPGIDKTITIDNLDFLVDSNWSQEGDEDWSLSLSGKEVALLVVDTINMHQFNNADSFDLMKLYILTNSNYFIAEGLSVFSFDEMPCLFFRVKKPETGKITIQYRLFVPRNEQFLSVIGLEVEEDIYLANKGYFDSVLF